MHLFQIVFTNHRGQKGTERCFVRKDYYWEEMSEKSVLDWLAYAMEHVELVPKGDGKKLTGAWAAPKLQAISVMVLLREEYSIEGWAETQSKNASHMLWCLTN